MVGLGGGFILVPVLRLFFGLLAGRRRRNVARAHRCEQRERRVHLSSATPRSPEDRLADRARVACPAASSARSLSVHISARLSTCFSRCCSIGVAVDMAWNAERRMAGRAEHAPRLTTIKGMSYRAALGLGFVVGIFSSLFGLGGGDRAGADVPLLFRAAGARDQRDLAVRDPADLAARARRCTCCSTTSSARDIVPLVAGGLLGGPIGARLSLRLKSPQLLLVVAAALVMLRRRRWRSSLLTH